MHPSNVPDDPNVVDDLFTYHRPRGDQLEKYERVRRAAKALARVLIENCPSSADRSAAIRKVREAVMTANAAIALNGE